MESPVIKKGTGLSPIWVLPLVALCIAGWLLYTSYRDAGITCIIHFEDAEGITAGKTQVMYKGVAVGIVEQITVDEDLQGVNLAVKMEKKARRGLVRDTKFWIVRPRISAGRVSGLETILSGSYIAVQPGSSTEPATRFEGLPEAPALSPESPGLRITLMSDALYSLQKDSPVYMKNLKIGKVLKYYLAEDRSVLIDLYIEPEFSHLIQMGTRFWNSSGFSLEGNLQSGFNLKLESMAALVYGGISCGTPEPLVETSPPALNGLVYKLYPNYEAAEYWLPMTLQLASGEGIIEGKTKVMFRGLEAGVVRKIRINNDENISVTAEILLDPRAEPILKEGTRFWLVRPEVSLSGISQVDTLISGPHITFMPGQGVFQDHFVVEREPMPRQIVRDGRHYTLVSEENGFLEAGSPVLFNRMTVGEVYKIDFAPDRQSVQTDILIYDEYTHLVRKNSVFWNSSGIRFDAGFSRVRLNIGTVKSLLKGGISFTTPKMGSTASAEPAAAADSFKLFASLAEATGKIRSLQPPGTVFQLHSTADLYYEVGSPVLYRKMPVGEVIGCRLSEDLQSVLTDILILEKFAGLVNISTLFYDSSGFSVDAGLRGIEVQAGSVASMLAGGISFVTPEKRESPDTNHSFTLYTDYVSALQHDRVQITVRLNRTAGVGEDTVIRYQGIEIGSVGEVRFGPEMKEVIATATVRKEAVTLFREKSRLEVIKPSIDFNGVHHLSTILTGPFINVVPGEGELCSDFILHPGAPRNDGFSGLNIILETPRLGFLNIGNPVYYRQVQVGRITGYDLSATAQNVLIRVNIYPEYVKLVYSRTKFWLASGLEASWGLFSGLQLDAESLESLVSGGIAFATPENEEMGEPAVNGDHFQLHLQKEMRWTAWSPKLGISPGESQVDKPGDTL